MALYHFNINDRNIRELIILLELHF